MAAECVGVPTGSEIRVTLSARIGIDVSLRIFIGITDCPRCVRSVRCELVDTLVGILVCEPVDAYLKGKRPQVRTARIGRTASIGF